jgi:hypothetical protein
MSRRVVHFALFGFFVVGKSGIEKLGSSSSYVLKADMMIQVSKKWLMVQNYIIKDEPRQTFLLEMFSQILHAHARALVLCN